jgi:hypothetical protein
MTRSRDWSLLLHWGSDHFATCLEGDLPTNLPAMQFYEQIHGESGSSWPQSRQRSFGLWLGRRYGFYSVKGSMRRYIKFDYANIPLYHIDDTF